MIEVEGGIVGGRDGGKMEEEVPHLEMNREISLDNKHQDGSHLLVKVRIIHNRKGVVVM